MKQPSACPFCGCERVDVYPNDHCVECSECPAGMQDRAMTIEQLIEKWNSRISGFLGETANYNPVLNFNLETK